MTNTKQKARIIHSHYGYTENGKITPQTKMAQKAAPKILGDSLSTTIPKKKIIKK